MVEADHGAAGAETTVVVGITVADHGVVGTAAADPMVEADPGAAVAEIMVAVGITAEEAARITEAATNLLFLREPSCGWWLRSLRL
jgi:hypothetical protein